ncbi:uncharacterized protein AB675_11909 [Cyphellophora attinorum]|uniref:Magnesium transport protein CorA n=1 Tax=Cyphellophora attinorum TaxID=1664694 RepID=A0A0N1HH40_9EURO|nr:uncharacterized protein AB675_11909 [Phialophora attinorum]KPI34972.1 hypothetical protein AB675_11909 [Phialophora attinorum]
MAVSRSVFRDIALAWNVPAQYWYLREHGNASGAFARRVGRDDQGNATSIVVMLRVPHSPRNEDKSIWSASFSWDVKRNSTRVLFDGLTSHDLSQFQQYAQIATKDFVHPYAMLNFTVSLLATYYTTMRQHLEVEIVGLERTLGITRGFEGFQGWNWSPETLRSYTQQLYRITTGPIYLERRLVFLISLAEFLRDSLSQLENEVPSLFAGKKDISVANKLQAEALENVVHLVSNQLHQTRCLDKRLGSMMTTLNTIVAQIDSRSNLEVARAARYDSSSMLTIAFLTATFLPPTFVCSLFGMNMFNFESSENSVRVVSPLFWLYWVITLPLTVAVLLTWKYWEHRRNRLIVANVQMVKQEPRVSQ